MKYHSIRRGEADYPALLLERLGDSAPETLWYFGNPALFQERCIGVCGSRKAFPQAISATREYVRLRVPEFVIVSGNASGIDLAAHRSALEYGGATILVLAEGISCFRVRSELKPFWDLRRVLVVSQFEPHAEWKSWQAMRRNGVVAGLSGVLVVAQAGETGGTINAGMAALKMSVPVQVMVHDRMREISPGGEALLNKGARGFPVSNPG